MKACKGCGAPANPPTGKIWLSEKGLCSVCNYDIHKWEEANLHHQAYCIICYESIMAPRVFDVHCLRDDMGYSGRPVCFECYEILKGLVPQKLDINSHPEKKKLPQEGKKIKKKSGLEKWF